MKASLSFSGDIPDYYDRYVFPANMKMFAVEAGRHVALLKPGKMLEVAAGTGSASECVLQQLNADVEYTLTDISEVMLAKARQRFCGQLITIEAADVSQLPYADSRFDTVLCLFGLMYFADRDRALQEMFRVLAPGGHLVTVVWDALEFHPFTCFFHGLMAKHIPGVSLNYQMIPYCCSSLDYLKSALEQAGFRQLKIVVKRLNCEPQSCRHFVESRCLGTPLGNELEALGQDRKQVIDQITHDLEQHYGDTLEGISRQGIIITAS